MNLRNTFDFANLSFKLKKGNIMKSILFLLLATASLFAQEAAPQPAPQGGIGAFLPFILLFVVMYLFFLRPKQKEMKKMDEMRKAMKKGDEVMTFAGIIGIVHHMDDTTVTLRTGSSTIKFQKAAIQSITTPAPDAPEAVKEESK